LTEISPKVDAPVSGTRDARLLRVEGDHTLAEALEFVSAVAGGLADGLPRLA